MPKHPWNDEFLNAPLKSRVRGLVLGLALGDAVGSKVPHVPEGPLEAGVATQLAAWTIEGTLRNLTRYGRLHPHLIDIGRYSYQRWGLLRGLEPLDRDGWNPFFWPEGDPQHAGIRGWLVDEPAMQKVRGSSPSTEKALATGRPTQSAGCQAMLRVLPVAAMALIQHNYYGGQLDAEEARTGAQEWARNLALLTHDDGQRQNASVVAIDVLVEAMTATDELKWAIKRAAYDPHEPLLPVRADLTGALSEGFQAPRDTRTLEQLAPDRTSWSALAGGIYAALSFPDEETIADAIEFAGHAVAGNSVAAFTAAILGARYGVEALPQNWLSRLEVGWVMDRLACDLVSELVEHQGGRAWKDDSPSEHRLVDPWWQLRYPGV